METYYDRLKPLSARDLSKIHQKTVEVLCKVGIWIESERAREIYKKHGCSVSGETVYFTEKVIDEYIAMVPPKFTSVARNQKRSIDVGGDSVHYAPSGGSALMMDFDGTQRPARLKDSQDFLKLSQVYDCIDFNRGVVSPSDIPIPNVPYETTLGQILLTDKPLASGNAETIDLVCIAFGITKEKMKADSEKGLAYTVGGINPLSPLGHTSLQTDRLIDVCQYGVPQVIAAMPFAGTSAPCTIPGLLISQNAENLSGIILAEMVNPGNICIYGCIGTITNMRNGSAPIGVPEARVIEAASVQIAKFYNMPTRGDGGLTEALTADYQAGAEAALHYYNATRCGINMIPGAGELGSWNHGSLEKFVLDCETIEYVKRIFRPLEVNDETTAVDVIAKVGPRGSYIIEPHTLRHFREFYEPQTFMRLTYDKWDRQGRKDAKERAREKATQLLAKYERPPIDPSIEKDLLKYVAEHKPVK